MATRTPSAAQPAAERKTKKVMVSVPTEMFASLKEQADKAKVSTPAFIRQALAQAVGYTGTLTAGRKYATPEERKAAGKAKRKDKADLMKRLYKEHQEKKPA